jgi:PPOX class probable F420-dependent enzyme
MARMKPEVLEAFLQRPIIAVLSTLRKNGRPYQVPVWFLWQDGVFWLTGTSGRVWCRQIFRDPRVSLCTESSEPIACYVAVDCTAEAVGSATSDIWPATRLLVEKYVGARGGDVDAFIATLKAEPRLLFRLTPDSWRAIDLTVYTGSRDDLAYQRRRAAETEDH